MKLQPNFSWQKYEKKSENSLEQFQYQLQNEHIQVANTVNATIDDESFFLRERQTSFTWIDGRPIYTKTIPVAAWTMVGTVANTSTNITGPFTVIRMLCCLSDGTASTSNTVQLPHLDTLVAANNITIGRNGTTISIRTGGTDYSAFSGYITLWYVKN